MTNKDFNILTFFKTRPLSYSSLSSFEWNRDQWHDNYILGIRSEPTEELKFGSLVDKRLQEDPTFLPHVPRYPDLQLKLQVVFAGIHCIGYADGFDPAIPALADYKTGKKAWDQKRADETDQLTFYALMLYITKKIKPEDLALYIHWLPTRATGAFRIELIDENDLVTIKTKRTMTDILRLGNKIKKTVKEMEEFVKNHE